MKMIYSSQQWQSNCMISTKTNNAVHFTQHFGSSHLYLSNCFLNIEWITAYVSSISHLLLNKGLSVI